MKRYRREIIVCIVLILATLSLYLRVLHYGFTSLDDVAYITKNSKVQAGWTKDGVLWAFTTQYHRHWHPITWLSHMTDCQLFGLDPGWHHLSSLFLHLVNTLLLFLVFRRMTGTLFQSAFVAALFALHPLHVETVVWIADRKDLLSAFFWMLTLGAYVVYSERPGVFRYLFVFLFFLLGLMAKSVVVSLPLVFLLLDFWPLKRFQPHERTEDERPTKLSLPPGRNAAKRIFRLLGEKFLFFLVLGSAALAAVYAIRRGKTLDLSLLWTTKRHLAIALDAYVTYIRKMLLPLDLALPYPYPETPPWWQAVAAGILLASITVVVIRWRRTKPYLMTGWLWYLVTLLPVIGLFRGGPVTMGDRYTYIPLTGLFIMIAWEVPRLTARWRHRRTVIGVSAASALLVLAAFTWFQVSHWQDNTKLYSRSLNVTENNLIAHEHLGNALMQKGKVEEAIAQYRQALQINPRYSKVHNALGVALKEQGKLDEAILHHSEALRSNPREAAAYNNLGIVLRMQGRLDAAIQNYRKALQIKPDLTEARNNLAIALRLKERQKDPIQYLTKEMQNNPQSAEARYNLATALMMQGNLEEAIDHYRASIRIKQDFAAAHRALGNALRKTGRYEEAITHYSLALRIEPRDAKAHFHLGNTLRKQGKLDEAMEHYAAAVEIKPDFAAAHNNLAIVLKQEGRVEEAITHYREALRINPQDANIHYNLGIALEEQDKLGEVMEH